MSLFTATSGTPERVWALVRILESLDGRGERGLVAGLLNPKFNAGGRTDDEESDAFTQTVQAAADLGLVERSSSSSATASTAALADGLALTTMVADSFLAFSDQLHAHLANLASDDADTLVLDAVAIVAAAADEHGSPRWFFNMSPKDQVEYLNHRLNNGAVETTSRFNGDRLPTWRRWTAFLGLTSLLPHGGGGRHYPYVAPRLAREIANADPSTLPRGIELPAATFMAWVSQRMPYLEGGRRYRALFRARGADRVGDGGSVRGPVSVLLSTALLDLHEDGLIRLSTTGDAADNLMLASDPFRTALTAFRTVSIAQGDEDRS